MQTQTYDGGFDAPATDSARAFRQVMQAMARPGTIHSLDGATPPKPLSMAAGAVILTLCDADTPVYLAGALECPEVRAWIAFHTGAPMAPASQCAFAVGTWSDLSPLSAYPIGTSEYPDRSATLIVETESLSNTGHTLTGPGIRDTAQLSLPEAEAFQANRRLFPLGLDFLFTCGGRVAALPRSTQINVTEGR